MIESITRALTEYEQFEEHHAMSDFLPAEGPVAPVPPLKSLKTNGEPFQRRPKVETQLGRILAIAPSKRPPGPDPPYVR